MDIDDLFQLTETFTAEAQITIPGNVNKGGDRTFTPTIEFLYIDEEDLATLRGGEAIEVDGQEIEPGDDKALLRVVVRSWSNWIVDGTEIPFSADNLEKAIKHRPIVTGISQAYHKRLYGIGNAGQASSAKKTGGRRGRAAKN